MTLELYWLEKCPYYDSRVVIYVRKMFIRLATGLVIMGGDSSRYKRSWVWIPVPYHFSHLFVAKIVLVFEKSKKRKRGQQWPILNKVTEYLLSNVSRLDLITTNGILSRRKKLQSRNSGIRRRPEQVIGNRLRPNGPLRLISVCVWERKKEWLLHLARINWFWWRR